MVHASEKTDQPAESPAVEPDERTAHLWALSVALQGHGFDAELVDVETRDQAGRHVQDSVLFVSKLRAEFPRWGVLHDPFGNVWWAVHHQLTLRAGSGIALREQMLDAGRW